MFKRFSTNYMTALFLMDGILIQLCLWVGMQLRFLLPVGDNLSRAWVPFYVYTPSWRLHLAVAVLWLFSFLTLSLYTPRRIVRWVDETQRLFTAHTIAALSLAGLLYMAQIELARLTYLYFYLLALFMLVSYRIVLRTWHQLRQNTSSSVARILIVGAGKVGCDLVAEFQRQQWPGIEFVGFLDDNVQKQEKKLLGLPILGQLDDAVSIIEREAVDEVIIALPAHAHNQLANLVAGLHEKPVRVRVVPDYFGLAFFGATVESLGGIPLIGLRDPAIDDFQRFAKRLLDIFLAAFALLFTSPLLVAIAIAIKLTSPGSIFYLQDRIGENQRRFKMIKFRSMVAGADRQEGTMIQRDVNGKLVHQKSPDDPRVTAVGKFIRRTSIDELPQFFNVLKGDMSLVGPRPEMPVLAEQFEVWQLKRFAVPQGITGWWQVNGRSAKSTHLKTEEDLYYIQNYSLLLDLKILFKTIWVVIQGKGAY